jgi:hypothetical protein
MWTNHFVVSLDVDSLQYRAIDASLSPLLDPLEGLSMLNYGKLGLKGRSRLPALEGGRGAC